MKWKIITTLHLVQLTNYMESLVPVPFDSKKNTHTTISYIFVT